MKFDQEQIEHIARAHDLIGEALLEMIRARQRPCMNPLPLERASSELSGVGALLGGILRAHVEAGNAARWKQRKAEWKGGQ